MASDAPYFLDTILDLEHDLYHEGYQAGFGDGSRQGCQEGHTLGVNRAFEKFLVMGRLQGRATVWQTRLDTGGIEGVTVTSPRPNVCQLPHITPNARVDRHIKTLHRLTAPVGLSFQNDEVEVAHVDDRMKRALAKSKMIEQHLGEAVFEDDDGTGPDLAHQAAATSTVQVAAETGEGEGNIEDLNVARARR